MDWVNFFFRRSVIPCPRDDSDLIELNLSSIESDRLQRFQLGRIVPKLLLAFEARGRKVRELLHEKPGIF